MIINNQDWCSRPDVRCSWVDLVYICWIIVVTIQRQWDNQRRETQLESKVKATVNEACTSEEHHIGMGLVPGASQFSSMHNALIDPPYSCVMS